MIKFSKFILEMVPNHDYSRSDLINHYALATSSEVTNSIRAQVRTGRGERALMQTNALKHFRGGIILPTFFFQLAYRVSSNTVESCCKRQFHFESSLPIIHKILTKSLS